MKIPAIQHSAELPWWKVLPCRLHRLVDKISVMARDLHTDSPTEIGNGQHDCALSALYWAVAAIPESDIVDAFNLATETWPHGGVTNKEYAIALKVLGVASSYSTEINTLGELLSTKPTRCVALLHGHFVPIVDGMIVGRDARRSWSSDEQVYCHWTFRKRSVQPARSSSRTSSGST